jgi:hypothetical protein
MDFFYVRYPTLQCKKRKKEKKKEMGFRYTINISTWLERERERERENLGNERKWVKERDAIRQSFKSSVLRNSDYWVSALAMAVVRESGFKSESGFSG